MSKVDGTSIDDLSNVPRTSIPYLSKIVRFSIEHLAHGEGMEEWRGYEGVAGTWKSGEGVEEWRGYRNPSNIHRASIGMIENLSNTYLATVENHVGLGSGVFKQ